MGNLIDYSGKVFGFVTVLGRAPNLKNKATAWYARCVCGKEWVVNAIVLRKGITSCGCKSRNALKHGHATKFKGVSPTYKTWEKMKERTLQKNSKIYKRYGAKGITICDRWLSFDNFLSDMGERPEPAELYSLDRIDNTKGYSPDNCRWATVEQQMNNRSCNILIEYKGLKGTLAQICRSLNFSYSVARYRLRVLKWAVEQVFETPIKRSK